MIVSRTPLRMSFFGGGTDYPQWYREHGGAVLSATIDKYCYLTVRRLPPFFAHQNRIVYRVIETTRTIDEIEHPTVKAVLALLGLDAMEIHHDGDLPARSGMGTSSAFTVGLLHACHALKGERLSKEALAHEAIRIEQVILEEAVGSQDQFAAAFGGINRIRFEPALDKFASVMGRDSIYVEPVPLPAYRRTELENHLLLFFTGISRTASDLAQTFVPELGRNRALEGAVKTVDEGMRVLCDPGPIEAFGDLLHEAWKKKRQIAPVISTPEVDELYRKGRAAGAIGGKLLGAGGGGFLLFFARPKDHAAIKAALGLLQVPFRFENEGSKIMVYEP